ncbi:MAG: hypothetical protein Q7S00_06845 [bacterium]|nr:hypothetical protein [bacterium]
MAGIFNLIPSLLTLSVAAPADTGEGSPLQSRLPIVERGPTFGPHPELQIIRPGDELYRDLYTSRDAGLELEATSSEPRSPVGTLLEEWTTATGQTLDDDAADGRYAEIFEALTVISDLDRTEGAVAEEPGENFAGKAARAQRIQGRVEYRQTAVNQLGKEASPVQLLVQAPILAQLVQDQLAIIEQDLMKVWAIFTVLERPNDVAKVCEQILSVQRLRAEYGGGENGSGGSSVPPVSGETPPVSTPPAEASTVALPFAIGDLPLGLEGAEQAGLIDGGEQTFVSAEAGSFTFPLLVAELAEPVRSLEPLAPEGRLPTPRPLALP